MEWLSWKQRLAWVIMEEEMKGGGVAGEAGPQCKDLQRDRCVCVCVVTVDSPVDKVLFP